MEASIPQTIATFFQEYKLENLNPQRDRSLIIERFLAFGSKEELSWLFRQYSWEEVSGWVDTNGHLRLPRSRYILWCVIFNLEQRSKPLGIWLH